MGKVKIKNLPNLITLTRLILLIPLAYFLYYRSYQQALIVFIVAGVSDGLDGILARSFHWTSRFGAIADPIADKLLMLVSYSFLAFQNILPMWLLMLVVGRDVLIVAGAWHLKHLQRSIKLSPTLMSKINTTLQIILVTAAMFALVFSFIPDQVTQILIWVVGLSSLISGIQYLMIAWHLKKNVQNAQLTLDQVELGDVNIEPRQDG
ncbi:MAG: hypothetical protein COW84_08960 [Gammaproteobacteria bacterium CG22_combo_CG10-13_8_21_14_all_40_8]|nr:MAG: hypothetical protein COW84_08960 [Gammaproteobacteria bacterium CG22_combo_CG10-13_8_21_14_all_40_8]